MSAIPLARLLVEFGPETDLSHSIVGSARSSEDTAARIAEAVARGREEGRAAAEADFAVRLEAERQGLEQRLASERLAWAAQESDALAGRILGAMRELEAGIAESTARILLPFLNEHVRLQAIAELTHAIEAAVAKDQGAVLAIRGPEDLIGLLREKLAGTGVNASYSIGSTPDVQVSLNDTVLQTRLEAWMARIREAVA